MGYVCKVEEQPGQPTLCIRTHAPVTALPSLVGKAFGDIVAVLAKQGESPAGMPFVAYKNLDMSNLDVEIGFPVSHPLAGAGDVQPGTLPAGSWATTMHVGPYSGVGPAFEALGGFVAASGRQPTGVAYEFYFDGPEVPPEKTRTRVAMPLSP